MAKCQTFEMFEEKGAEEGVAEDEHSEADVREDIGRVSKAKLPSPLSARLAKGGGRGGGRGTALLTAAVTTTTTTTIVVLVMVVVVAVMGMVDVVTGQVTDAVVADVVVVVVAVVLVLLLLIRQHQCPTGLITTGHDAATGRAAGRTTTSTSLRLTYHPDHCNCQACGGGGQGGRKGQRNPIRATPMWT